MSDVVDYVASAGEDAINFAKEGIKDPIGTTKGVVKDSINTAKAVVDDPKTLLDYDYGRGAWGTAAFGGNLALGSSAPGLGIVPMQVNSVTSGGSGEGGEGGSVLGAGSIRGPSINRRGMFNTINNAPEMPAVPETPTYTDADENAKLLTQDKKKGRQSTILTGGEGDTGGSSKRGMYATDATAPGQTSAQPGKKLGVVGLRSLLG